MDPGGLQPKLPLGGSQRRDRLRCFPRSLTCTNRLEVLFLHRVIYIESFKWQFFFGDDIPYIPDFHTGIQICHFCERVSFNVDFFKRRLVALGIGFFKPKIGTVEITKSLSRLDLLAGYAVNRACGVIPDVVEVRSWRVIERRSFKY